MLSFVLAEAEPGLDVDEVCRRIEKQTGLRAVTGKQFEWITMTYFMQKTGIPFNFGITVALGFHRRHGDRRPDVLLVHDRKHQAIRRAQGDGRRQLVADGDDPAASAAGEHDRLWPGHRRGARGSARSPLRPARGWRFTCRGKCLSARAWPSVAISILSSLLSMQRVMVVEPAVVFQG